MAATAAEKDFRATRNISEIESTFPSLENYSWKATNILEYRSTLQAQAEAILRTPKWQSGQTILLPPELQQIRLSEKLAKESSGVVVVVGGGATAVAAISELNKLGVLVVHIYDPKDLAGQTKKIDWNIHKDLPTNNQLSAVKTFSSPLLSIGEKLEEEQINEVACTLGADYIVDARGLTNEDEKHLIPSDPQHEIKYGQENGVLVSRDFIDLTHNAMKEMDANNPQPMIDLLTSLDLSNVVISGAGKVGTQDLVAKVRLLQIAQKVYKESGVLLDLQKLSERNDKLSEANVVMGHAANLGITTKDLGKITVVNRSMPRIIDPTPAQLSQASNIWEQGSTAEPTRDDLIEIVRKNDQEFIQKTYDVLKEWQEGYGFEFVEGVTPETLDPTNRSITYTVAEGYDDKVVNPPNNTSLLISALGVKKYGYPKSFTIPGNVTGMRAVGSGNISASAQDAKKVVKELQSKFATSHSPAQNSEVYQNYLALTQQYTAGNPLLDMITKSPKILTRDWIHDPMPLNNPTDLQISLQQKTAEITTFESKILLKYVYEKLGYKTTGEEDLNLQISQDGTITIGADNKPINSFDDLATAIAVIVDQQYSPSNNPLEDALIARSANSLQNMRLDLSLRYTQTVLRKLGYSDEQILSLEANLITEQFPLSSEGKVSETFDSNLSSWAKTLLGSPQTSSPEQQKLFTFTKSDIAAIMLSILTGSAASLLDMDHHLFYTIARNGIGFSTLILAINEILSKECDQTLNRGARFAILSFATSMISYLATSLILKD